MTLDEALAEIELAPGADADAIRRAYLRKLKTRRPETDPEGFRRLREAFERLSGPPEAPDDVPGPTPAPQETDSVDLAEPARLERRDDPADLARAATTWLARDDVDLAVATMLRALETAEERGQPTPSFGVLQLILELHAQDLPAEAVRVQERLAQHLRTAGRELDLGPHLAALWQIAQEIPRLPPDFPQPVRTVISQAVHDGTLETALHTMQGLIRDDPYAGERMAADLQELPALRSLFHEVVLAELSKAAGGSPSYHSRWPVMCQPAKAPAPPKIGFRQAGLRVLGQLLLMSLLLFLVDIFAGKPPTPPPVPMIATVDQAVETACRDRKPPTAAEADLCQVVRKMAVDLGQGRCEEARTAQAALLRAQALVLQQDIGRDLFQAPELNGVVLRLFAESRRICSSP